MAATAFSNVPNLSEQIQTGTSSAGAITLNAQLAVVTTESLTTAAGADYSLTMTNSYIGTASYVNVCVLGGSNTRLAQVNNAVAGAGSVVIKIRNNEASNAFNGTLKLGVLVL